MIIKSFGDYNSNGWEKAVPYLDGDINALYLSSIALLMGGKQISKILITALSYNLSYMLPYYASTGYLTKDVIRIKANYNSLYNIEYIHYTYSSADRLSLSGTPYTAFEQEYYEYVKQIYLQLPDSTRLKLMENAAKNNLLPGSRTLIEDVASFVQNSVKYD